MLLQARLSYAASGDRALRPPWKFRKEEPREKKIFMTGFILMMLMKRKPGSWAEAGSLELETQEGGAGFGSFF